jgi:hypothetical protein
MKDEELLDMLRRNLSISLDYNWGTNDLSVEIMFKGEVIDKDQIQIPGE